jgi:hypothetical protein
MIQFNRLFRPIFVISLTTVCGPCNAAAGPPIIPVRTTLYFSLHSSEHRWSFPIKTTNGSTAYILSLEKDYSVGNHLAGVTLVLHRFADKPDAQNLLDPPGTWHGIQPCDFVANDLAHGIQKSVFGEKRTIPRKDLRLVVRISTSSATVSPASNGDYQLDAITLIIEIDNSNP